MIIKRRSRLHTLCFPLSLWLRASPSLDLMPSCFPMIFQMEGCARCGRTPRREIRGPFSETSPLIAFGVWLCFASLAYPPQTRLYDWHTVCLDPNHGSSLFCFFRSLAPLRDTIPILVRSSLKRSQASMAGVSTPPPHV